MKKYAIVEISTKKKIICDTESKHMWISADKAYGFLIFQILLLDDVIPILYRTYEFRFAIRVSNLVGMPNFYSWC